MSSGARSPVCLTDTGCSPVVQGKSTFGAAERRRVATTAIALPVTVSPEVIRRGDGFPHCHLHVDEHAAHEAGVSEEWLGFYSLYTLSVPIQSHFSMDGQNRLLLPRQDRHASRG